MRAGPKFGNQEGCILIVCNALYGLKSSGVSFWEFLAERLDDIGFCSSIADPDVRLCKATKPDGELYYEYILCYVNHILCICHDPNQTMAKINSKLPFKDSKIQPPDFYLGAKLEQKLLSSKKTWIISSTEYVKHNCKSWGTAASKKVSNSQQRPQHQWHKIIILSWMNHLNSKEKLSQYSRNKLVFYVS